MESHANIYSSFPSISQSNLQSQFILPHFPCIKGRMFTETALKFLGRRACQSLSCSATGSCLLCSQNLTLFNFSPQETLSRTTSLLLYPSFFPASLQKLPATQHISRQRLACLLNGFLLAERQDQVLPCEEKVRWEY